MSGNKMGVSGLTYDQLYKAVAQAIIDNPSGGGGGGFTAPSLIVTGTASYTVPVGYNARVTFQSYATGQGLINGTAVMRTQGRTWSNMYINSNVISCVYNGKIAQLVNYGSPESYSSAIYGNNTADASDCLSTSHNVKAGTTIATSGNCIYCIELYAI